MMHHLFCSLLPTPAQRSHQRSSSCTLVTRERGIVIARPFGLNKLPCHRGESTELSILAGLHRARK